MTTSAPADSGQLIFDQCSARWTPDELVLGNAKIERRWHFDQGWLYAQSIYDKAAQYEWLAGTAPWPAPVPPHAEATVATAHITAAVDTPTLTGAAALVVTVIAGARTTRLWLYPDTAAVSVQLITGPATDAPAPVETRDGIERCTLRAQHVRLRQVLLADQTDGSNTLVQEREWLLHPCETLALTGNLFILEDTRTGAGLILLKEAPLPHARPCPCDADLRIANVTHLAVDGHGMGGGMTEGYPTTLLTFQNGRAGCTRALHHYQRQVRRYNPARDGLFLSNTWGDRSQDTRVNEAFMRQEVDAGAALGVEVIQIDDGWQKGRTINSAESGGVWEGYWRADSQFWEPHPDRFPHGLSPVTAPARAYGMQFGLWFSPDSSHDFANWQRDAEVILHWYRDEGVRYVKIDGVKAHTRLGEMNLRRFFDAVLRDSAGEVVFDLDITAEIRPGYFGLMHAGPLFVENRYTDWHNYWPHQTLRNLWMLAQYLDPLRLRMEFLNHTRNADRYAGDPLAPAHYRADYLFAATMIANPLGWFEISNLPTDYVAAVAPLVQVWKAHRARLHGGHIFPIGAPPDGSAGTGFAVAGDDDGGYLLLFRELNDHATWSTELPVFSAGAYHCATLAGDGTAVVHDGRLTAQMPHPLSYVFVRVARRR